MKINRRQALATAAAFTPTMLSWRALAASVPDVQTLDDIQFTPGPSPPTNEELQLFATAVDSARRVSASELIQDARFMPLHPQPVFRELVKAIAREPVLTIAREDEPGTRIDIQGTIVDPYQSPVAAAMVYVYHTSAKGWYSDKGAHIRSWAGDARHARLFGYLRTGPQGSFEVRTIKPGGYPKSTLPQHIHIEVEADGCIPLGTELLFDDDPRLNAEQRQRAKREGFLIAQRVSVERPTYRYTIGVRKT
jgi:protocatechuate 3,4-dioxygenase beta subunit